MKERGGVIDREEGRLEKRKAEKARNACRSLLSLGPLVAINDPSPELPDPLNPRLQLLC